MPEEPSLSIRIDDRLDDYRNFFDHRWAEQIRGLANGSKLAEHVAALTINWQGAANACAMPWLMVRTLQSEWAGFLLRQEPFSLRITSVLAERLSSEMGDALSHAKRKRLAALVRQIGGEIHGQGEVTAQFEPHAIWRTLIRDDQFRLALWGSQRIGYGSIYHAYENFVRQCIATAKGKPDYGGRRIQSLLRHAREFFGKRLADASLASRDVRVARLVRNALAHGGGRETVQLRETPHGLAVDNGMVQVLATDSRQLFDRLKRRAFRLVAKAVTLPQVR